MGSHAPAKLIAHLRGNRTSPERYTHTYRSHPSSAGLHALAAGKRAPRAAGDHIHTSAACLCIGGLVVPQTGHGAHHRVRAQTQRRRRGKAQQVIKRAPTPSSHPRPERGAPRGGHTYIYHNRVRHCAHTRTLAPVQIHKRSRRRPPPPPGTAGAYRQMQAKNLCLCILIRARHKETIPGPYAWSRQRQRHAHEQVQPGQRREHPGPSRLLRPDHRTARGRAYASPHPNISLRSLARRSRTHRAGREQSQGHTYLHTSANATPTSRCHRGNLGSSPDPTGFCAPDHSTARGRAHASPCPDISQRSLARRSRTRRAGRTIPGPNTSPHQRQRHGHEQVQPGQPRE